MDLSKKIICAIDTQDLSKAINLTKQVSPYVGGVKLGLEFFCAHGPQGVLKIKEICQDLVLDLKFFDIPNTLYSAVKSCQDLEPFMMTIHSLASSDSLKAAKEASLLYKQPPMIMAVTLLTSFDQNNLEAIGIQRKIDDQVRLLARLAFDNNLDGVVCSPLEIEFMKREFPHLKLLVPGIRSATQEKTDQKRTLSARQALDLGADYIVIGRPITKAEDPALAAKNILNE